MARQLLAEQGPDKLTMDGLAERAGLGKGTVFRRFGTRAGIFQALLDDDERAFHREIARGALDGRESVPAGARSPMSREHIRALLGQQRLGGVDLDVLSTQLAAALDGPPLLYLSSEALAEAAPQVAERLGQGWEDLIRRICPGPGR